MRESSATNMETTNGQSHAASSTFLDMIPFREFRGHCTVTAGAGGEAEAGKAGQAGQAGPRGGLPTPLSSSTSPLTTHPLNGLINAFPIGSFYLPLRGESGKPRGQDRRPSMTPSIPLMPTQRDQRTKPKGSQMWGPGDRPWTAITHHGVRRWVSSRDLFCHTPRGGEGGRTLMSAMPACCVQAVEAVNWPSYADK